MAQSALGKELQRSHRAARREYTDEKNNNVKTETGVSVAYSWRNNYINRRRLIVINSRKQSFILVGMSMKKQDTYNTLFSILFIVSIYFFFFIPYFARARARNKEFSCINLILSPSNLIISQN